MFSGLHGSLPPSSTRGGQPRAERSSWPKPGLHPRVYGSLPAHVGKDRVQPTWAAFPGQSHATSKFSCGLQKRRSRRPSQGPRAQGRKRPRPCSPEPDAEGWTWYGEQSPARSPSRATLGPSNPRSQQACWERRDRGCSRHDGNMGKARAGARTLTLGPVDSCLLCLFLGGVENQPVFL